jgi:gamma-glutamylaminecyclotransferase
MSHLVFVYGSLKRGYQNYAILRDSAFVGPSFIYGPYKMVSLGAFPGVVKIPFNETSWRQEPWHYVAGELYKVDDLTLERLDILESNGSFYQREMVDGMWVYFLLGDAHMHPEVEMKDGIYSW